MEENIYLNEILYLINKNYYDNKIDIEDLQKIELSISNIKNNNVPELAFDKGFLKHNFYFLHKLSKSAYPIDPDLYKKIRNILINSSTINEEFKKIFKYTITPFVPFIKKNEDIRIHLIEINIGKLELAFEIDSAYYTYSNNNLNKIDDSEKIKGYISNFNKNLGKVLDSNLEELSNSKFKNNTRNILIDYNTNFNEIINYVNNGNIIIKNLILECGIIDKGMKNENRFTMMMYFIKNDGEILTRQNGTKLYFDTFCLNPPDNC